MEAVPAYHFVTFQRGRGWQVRTSADDRLVIDFLGSPRVAEALMRRYNQDPWWKKND